MGMPGTAIPFMTYSFAVLVWLVALVLNLGGP
jgi:hypothetical protein